MGYLAEHLRAVGVEEDTVLSADGADLFERLDDANFVVDAHHGHKASLVGNGTLQNVQVHKTVLLHRKIGDLESSFRKPAAAIQHALVLLLVTDA